MLPVVINQRLSERREISGRRVVCHPLFRWKENERLPGLQHTAFSSQPHASRLPRPASQTKSFRRRPTPKQIIIKGHRGFVWVLLGPMQSFPAVLDSLAVLVPEAASSRPHHGGPFSVARSCGQGWREAPPKACP